MNGIPSTTKNIHEYTDNKSQFHMSSEIYKTKYVCFCSVISSKLFSNYLESKVRLFLKII